MDPDYDKFSAYGKQVNRQKPFGQTNRGHPKHQMMTNQPTTASDT
jgi:hypothetical protein